MLESTATQIQRLPTEDAPKAQDTRAPVGLDAGAPQVTNPAADEGGWHGGAEEGAGGGTPAATPEKAPLGAQAGSVAEMDLDLEARVLAQEAMEAAGAV